MLQFNRYAFNQFLKLVLALGVFYSISCLEYDDFQCSTYVFPLFLLFLFGILEYLLAKLHIVFAILGFPIFALIFLFFILASVMCANTKEGTAYKHKEWKAYTIIEKTLNCGAWDSHPDHMLYKQITLTQHLAFVWKLNDSKIDTTQWIPIVKQ